MQGIKVSQPNAPKRNRIEEAIGRAPTAEYSAPVMMPKIEPKREPAPKASDAGRADRSYGTFLKKFFLGLLIIIFLAVVGLGGYAAFQAKKHPKTATAQDTIAEVGKLIALPNETPSVATISDLKPLEGQEFFKDAAIGDKVLIFNTAKKAVLYRPSVHKVINVAPLGENQSAPQQKTH